MSEDKIITVEITTFIKYKDECYEVGEVIKGLLNNLDEKNDEIERLKKREQECIDHYLVQCKYASEMEDKYITANNIINELENYFNKIKDTSTLEERMMAKYILKYIKELKGDGSNE